MKILICNLEANGSLNRSTLLTTPSLSTRPFQCQTPAYFYFSFVNITLFSIFNLLSSELGSFQISGLLLPRQVSEWNINVQWQMTMKQKSGHKWRKLITTVSGQDLLLFCVQYMFIGYYRISDFWLDKTSNLKMSSWALGSCDGHFSVFSYI